MTGQTNSVERRDWSWLIIGLAMLISAIPLLVPAIAPLSDLPGHIGRYAIQLGVDHDPFLAQHYSFTPQIVGNLGFDLLVLPLAALFGLEPAVKLLVIVTAMAMSGGMLWAAREAHGQIPPAAGFALPFVFGFPFQFGFINYCLSLAMAFGGLALWLRMTSVGLRRPMVFAALGMITWLIHAVGWGILGLLVFAAEMARAGLAGQTRGRSTIIAGIACLPLALPVLLMGYGAVVHDHDAPTRFIEFSNKIAWIAMALNDRSKAFDLASIGVVIAVLIGALGLRPLGFNRILGFGTVLLLIAFLAMPFMLFGSAYADMRMAIPLFATALLAIRVQPSASPKWGAAIMLVGIVFFAIRTTATTRSFIMHERSVARELAAIGQIPRNARVLALVGQACEARWMLSRVMHIPSIAIARKHAFTNDQFAAEGAQLVRVRHRAAGAFAQDPSQLVVGEACPPTNWLPLSQALATFPRDAFDFVWLVQPPRDRRADFTGLEPVWTNGVSTLYRIERNAPRPVLSQTTQQR
jgi:hypothetical protein